MNRRAFGAAVVTTAMASQLAMAQAPGAAPVDEVVREVARLVREEYVDVAVAERVSRRLLSNQARGEYRGLTTPAALAGRLTEDLRALSSDKHFAVRYEPPHVKRGDGELALAEDDLHPRFINYGMQTVARMAGNIGLIGITHFPSPPDRFIDRYAAAFNFLRDTSAMVLDLTENHGGGVDTAALLVSYFVDGEVELGRINYRKAPPEITLTRKEVPGERYGQSRPLFIAVSPVTFSAGEAIAFQLRRLKRATIVGQQTRGGAHPGDFFPLPGGFRIFVSTGKGVGPDWEGAGIQPDVATAPGEAVRTAHRLAVEAVLKEAGDEKTRRVLTSILEGRSREFSGYPL